VRERGGERERERERVRETYRETERYRIILIIKSTVPSSMSSRSK